MEAILYKFFSAMSQGAAFSFFALGIAVAFIWMKFPDLTGDGSFTLGGVVVARLISFKVSVWIAMPVAMLAGFLAGMGTYALHKYFRVPKILAGVLMMMALYTVNLRILGRPNFQIPRSSSIFHILPETLGTSWALSMFLIIAAVTVLVVLILYVYLESRSGLLLRVSGVNPKMAVIQGISPKRQFLGLGLSNALIAFSGAIIAQRSYSADIHMGTGQVIVAVAALFIGMVIFRKVNTTQLILASVVGSLLYMLLMQLALEVGVQAQDFRLISTLIVLASIVLASVRSGHDSLKKGADAFGIDFAR